MYVCTVLNLLLSHLLWFDDVFGPTTYKVDTYSECRAHWNLAEIRNVESSDPLTFWYSDCLVRILNPVVKILKVGQIIEWWPECGVSFVGPSPKGPLVLFVSLNVTFGAKSSCTNRLSLLQPPILIGCIADRGWILPYWIKSVLPSVYDFLFTSR